MYKSSYRVGIDVGVIMCVLIVWNGCAIYLLGVENERCIGQRRRLALIPYWWYKRWEQYRRENGREEEKWERQKERDRKGRRGGGLDK